MEQSWENQFVALSHKDCINGKHTPDNQDANGCHFGFSNKLFDFIIELFKEPVGKKEVVTEKSPEVVAPEEDYEVIPSPEPKE